ncbi:uncharacterized protein CIMG_06661 [Coccidioides immitis RS]|uniref:Uncharacterized protein n=1 Tax=Coccidioides immitis (strain RS) TaxID=246410 RepID=A0A0E1RW37_COCIM|nr:uncharacterized protein CIMG_06661 [Coccidioides immitis RS]EAS31182.1 hypothetical protein CIMG_06661 [Coccidioides immitis RS]
MANGAIAKSHASSSTTTTTKTRPNDQTSKEQASRRAPRIEKFSGESLKIRFPARIVRAYLRKQQRRQEREQPKEELKIRFSAHVVTLVNTKRRWRESLMEAEKIKTETRWQEQRIEEWRAVIDETLICGEQCGLVSSLTVAMMEADLASGVYIPTRDPAYLIATGEDDAVSPTSQRPPTTYKGYMEFATEDQKEFLKRAPFVLEPFALYTLHRHLHEHRRARDSFLQVCRDENDLQEYSMWVNRMKPETFNAPIDSGECEGGWQRQVHGWRNNAHVRAKRLAERREGWKRIMKRRTQERRQTFLRMNEKQHHARGLHAVEGERRLQRNIRRFRGLRMGDWERGKPEIQLLLRFLPRNEHIDVLE